MIKTRPSHAVLITTETEKMHRTEPQHKKPPLEQLQFPPDLH